MTLPLAGWAVDVPSQARGWMKMDVTGTLTALDPAKATLTPWGKELGTSPEIKLKGLNQLPDFWVQTSRGGAWVITGTQLLCFDNNGKQIESLKLPGHVGDLCWDGRGFILSYRTPEPYLERRNLKDGKLEWAVGTQPQGAAQATTGRHYVAMDSDDKLVVTTDGNPSCLVLDVTKGQLLSQATFKMNGQDAPSLRIPQEQPAGIHWIPGQKAYLRATEGSQLGGASGLTLVRYDLDKKSITLHPTGLASGHVLLGVFDDEAFFSRPEGGLTFIPFK